MDSISLSKLLWDENTNANIHVVKKLPFASCCTNLHIAVTPEEDYPKIVETYGINLCL